jgi:uncharacterized membrane protein SpoIIM required for sporulation
VQTRDEFVAQRQARWDELERLLLPDTPLYRREPRVISRVGALYRALCSDLMRARSLDFGQDISDHLNALASRAHNALYGPRPFSLRAVSHFLSAGFPQTLRRNWRTLAIAHLVFYLPLVIACAATMVDRRFALNILSPSVLESMASAYSEGFDAGRDGGVDSAMTGFYVYNNVGIAFRCFATGVLFGVGSLFFMLYNGLTIGATLGYVSVSGHGMNIFTFICGHGPFELTAIVISGAAGLKMGYALVATHGATRLGSLKANAPELAELILGAATMLLIAALIEGFWSPSSVPPPIKWAFSAAASLGLLAYVIFAGRGSQRAA